MNGGQTENIAYLSSSALCSVKSRPEPLTHDLRL
jgi:hypothetical protein